MRVVRNRRHQNTKFLRVFNSRYEVWTVGVTIILAALILVTLYFTKGENLVEILL